MLGKKVYNSGDSLTEFPRNTSVSPATDLEVALTEGSPFMLNMHDECNTKAVLEFKMHTSVFFKLDISDRDF